MLTTQATLTDYSSNLNVTLQILPKLGYSNERVFCISINRVLKMQFTEGLFSVLQLTALDKKCKNMRRFFIIFCHKARIFTVSKNT